MLFSVHWTHIYIQAMSFLCAEHDLKWKRQFRFQFFVLPVTNCRFILWPLFRITVFPPICFGMVCVWILWCVCALGVCVVVGCCCIYTYDIIVYNRKDFVFLMGVCSHRVLSLDNFYLKLSCFCCRLYEACNYVHIDFSSFFRLSYSF